MQITKIQNGREKAENGHRGCRDLLRPTVSAIILGAGNSKIKGQNAKLLNPPVADAVHRISGLLQHFLSMLLRINSNAQCRQAQYKCTQSLP